MFVGMENIMLSNHSLADEALNAANSMCDGDPLLVNELGVMAFNHGLYVASLAYPFSTLNSPRFRYEKAVGLFQHALDLAQVTQSSQKTWATTYLNLGTCHRKLKYAPHSVILERNCADVDLPPDDTTRRRRRTKRSWTWTHDTPWR